MKAPVISPRAAVRVTISAEPTEQGRETGKQVVGEAVGVTGELAAELDAKPLPVIEEQAVRVLSLVEQETAKERRAVQAVRPCRDSVGEKRRGLFAKER